MTGKTYEHYVYGKLLFLLGLVVLLGVTAFWAINAGSMKLSLREVWLGISGRGPEEYQMVVRDIRLPRVMGAVLAGLALGVAGNVQQVLLRNPLASPFTLGISQAAAFGAAFAIIVLGAGTYQAEADVKIEYVNRYLVSLAAFICSAATTLLVLWLSSVKRLAPEAIVLAGVALGSLFAAATTLLQYFASEIKVAAVVFWSFGDLGRLGKEEIKLLAVLIAGSSVYFVWQRLGYNALLVGEDSARTLGVEPVRLRFVGMLLSSLVAAAVTSFCGIIGFVGLLAPHMVRRVIGQDQRFLLPGAGLLGGVLLLVADTVARTVVSPIILPVGAITSFLGAPLFLFLLLRSKVH